MLIYPDIDPVALSLGPLAIHWYGLMYLIGFVGGWWLGRVRADRPGSIWTRQHVDDLVFYMAIGAVLGGRLGYVLFYNFDAFLNNPLILLQVWSGGMSFHGGLLGVMAALWLFNRKSKMGYWRTADFIAPFVTIGLGAGRLGNFINGELWGKVTTMPWGMVFPHVGPEPRHASMLYQFFLEGVVLFAILWWFSRKPRPLYATSGLFGLCYGLFRFMVEFVREPDAHIGYLAFGWFTMGQALTLPMMAAGLFLLWLAYRGPTATASAKAR